jgi:hypothetical protein
MRKLHPKPKVKRNYRGVTWDSRRGKWRCQIVVEGQYNLLGLFSDPILAAGFYDKAKMEAKESVEGGLKRKAKTNVELGRIDPLYPQKLEVMNDMLKEAAASGGRVGGCFFPPTSRLFK